MSPRPLTPLLDLEDFVLLRELVHEVCGVVLRDELLPLVQRRLAPRLEALGLPGFAAYHHLLRHDPEHREELEFVLDALTTHETYFFREPRQLEVFCEVVLPALAERNRETRRLRLWSAGCASGEEAYTLAMLVLDSGLFPGWDIGIFGTDVSRRVLVQARAAEYGASALRATGSDLRRRHFQEVGPGRWRVSEAARSLATFAPVNLLEPADAALLPRMDAVFCRNVLIYLDRPARHRVLGLLHQRLVDEGYLLLGHAEHLLSHTTAFEPVHLGQELLYRRRAGGGGTPAP